MGDKWSIYSSAIKTWRNSGKVGIALSHYGPYSTSCWLNMYVYLNLCFSRHTEETGRTWKQRSADGRRGLCPAIGWAEGTGRAEPEGVGWSETPALRHQPPADQRYVGLILDVLKCWLYKVISYHSLINYDIGDLIIHIANIATIARRCF